MSSKLAVALPALLSESSHRIAHDADDGADVIACVGNGVVADVSTVLGTTSEMQSGMPSEYASVTALGTPSEMQSSCSRICRWRNCRVLRWRLRWNNVGDSVGDEVGVSVGNCVVDDVGDAVRINAVADSARRQGFERPRRCHDCLLISASSLPRALEGCD